MKKYEEKVEKVVRTHVCVSLACDLCGKLAEDPANSMPWEWGGVGMARAGVEMARAIDGDYDEDYSELCPSCAEKLISAIKNKTLVVPWKDSHA